MHEPPEHGEGKMDGTPGVHWIQVVPRKHTGETVVLLIALALMFVLLFVMLGHPARQRHAGVVVPAHASEKR